MYVSGDFSQEIAKQHTSGGDPFWNYRVMIGCILRSGYILGQRAERAKKNNKGDM